MSPVKKQKYKKCKVLENKNAETDKQLEKELSVSAETWTGSDNGKLNRKKRKIFENIVWQTLEKLESWQKLWSRKCKQNPKELEGMKKGKPSIVRIRCLKKILKNFTET